MSVQTQIDRIAGNVSAALAAIADKGVTVPDGSTSDALAELIASIEAGTTIEMGSFTPVEDCNVYTISHNLGTIPTFALFFANGIENNSYSFIYDNGTNRLCWFCNSYYLSGTSNFSTSYLHKTSISSKSLSDSSMFNATENTIKVGNNSATVNYLVSGITYSWLLGVV